MFIVVQVAKDTVEPYASSGRYIPYVIATSDLHLTVGSRLDWGILQYMVLHGYTVTILPSTK